MSRLRLTLILTAALCLGACGKYDDGTRGPDPVPKDAQWRSYGDMPDFEVLADIDSITHNVRDADDEYTYVWMLQHFKQDQIDGVSKGKYRKKNTCARPSTAPAAAWRARQWKCATKKTYRSRATTFLDISGNSKRRPPTPMVPTLCARSARSWPTKRPNKHKSLANAEGARCAQMNPSRVKKTMSQTLLIELFTEELPPKALPKLGASFAQTLFDELAKLGFVDKSVEYFTFASPRRLAVSIPDVVRVQPDQQIEKKGPAVAAGFKDGQPTPALAGFARSCGVTPEQLEKKPTTASKTFLCFAAPKPGKNWLPCWPV